MAGQGDQWAVAKLLSRPIIEPLAEPYWIAFLDLAIDRESEFISAGLGGGIHLPCRLPRRLIREEGQRLGYEADALEDFVRIVLGVDRLYVDTEAARSAAQLQRDASRARNTSRR